MGKAYVDDPILGGKSVFNMLKFLTYRGEVIIKEQEMFLDLRLLILHELTNS